MHGLIFETSIWLLAGSTRFYENALPLASKPKFGERAAIANLAFDEEREQFGNTLYSEENRVQEFGFAHSICLPSHTPASRLTKNAFVTETSANNAPLSFQKRRSKDTLNPYAKRANTNSHITHLA